MNTKYIKDYFKSLPAASDLSGKSVTVSDNDGMQYRAPSAAFAITSKTNAVLVGTVVRVTKFTSVLVSIRGYLGGRCTLAWVSSYGPGSSSRTTAVALYPNNNYSFWINGSSDGEATLYIRSEYPSAEDFFSITSIDGAVPAVETVPAVPADATRILNN